MNAFKVPARPSGPELLEGFISGCQQTLKDAERSIEWWQGMADKYPEVLSFKTHAQSARERHARWVERCAQDVHDLREELTKLGLLPTEGAE